MCAFDGSNSPDMFEGFAGLIAIPCRAFPRVATLPMNSQKLVAWNTLDMTCRGSGRRGQAASAIQAPTGGGRCERTVWPDCAILTLAHESKYCCAKVSLT